MSRWSPEQEQLIVNFLREQSVGSGCEERVQAGARCSACAHEDQRFCQADAVGVLIVNAPATGSAFFWQDTAFCAAHARWDDPGWVPFDPDPLVADGTLEVITRGCTILMPSAWDGLPPYPSSPPLAPDGSPLLVQCRTPADWIVRDRDGVLAGRCRGHAAVGGTTLVRSISRTGLVPS